MNLPSVLLCLVTGSAPIDYSIPTIFILGANRSTLVSERQIELAVPENVT